MSRWRIPLCWRNGWDRRRAGGYISMSPSAGSRNSWWRCAVPTPRKSSPRRMGAPAGKRLPSMSCRGFWGLKEPPRYIESYDISNTAGSENVAGMVVFEDGRPLKSAYKKFKIKGFEGQDDYASMNEVLTRRFTHYFEEKETGKGFGRLPDLILLDGGKGQVAAVAPVLRQFHLDIPLFGMVKDEKHRTRAIASLDGEIAISMTRSAYTLVSSIQEEVHRFAIGYHRQRRSRSALSSTLLSIDGVGPARAKALLSHFGSVGRIKQASEEELAAVKGMSAPAAKAIRLYFDTVED